MKIEVIKNKLKSLITAAERVTAKNHSLPVLSLIILETDKSSLKIKATNLEVGLEAYLPAKIEIQGKVAVSAQVLSQLLNFSANDNEKVLMELEDSVLVVKTNRSISRIKTYPTDDFPSLPRVVGDQVFTILVSDLVVNVKSVIYASATSDIKPEIASVYIYNEPPYLIFVAADSFRLAEKKLKIKINHQLPSLIIPFKNITEIIKVIEGEGGEVEIHVSETQVSFLTENFYLTSRIINGSFPDYKQIIPKKFKTEVEVEKEDLMSSLKLANVFTDRFNQVLMTVNKDGLQIESKNQEIGENKVLSQAVVTGEEMAVYFNSRYMIESFPYFLTSRITLAFEDKNKPIVLRGVGDDSFQYLIMPINR